MFKKSLVRLTLLLTALTAGLFIVQMSRLVMFTRKLSYDLQPLVRHVPGATLKVLVVGDSTAVGTGAADNSQSLAGWLSRDFPRADITNWGVNGKKLNQLAEELETAGEHFALMIVQIGGNDILRFTALVDVQRDLDTVIADAKRMADTVVILHSGNVGLSPVFIWPLSAFYDERSRAVRALYMRKAREAGVLYVDLFTERSDDPFLKDVGRYYSADQLHPSGEGYRWWYQRLRETLAAAKADGILSPGK